MYIVNVANHSQPVVLGQIDTQGYTEGVAVVGGYAYIADGPTGLRVVDISDPAKPTEVAAVYSLNYVFDVTLAGNYAYLAAAGAGLLVVDLSNPKQPKEFGSCDTPGYAYGVAVSGSILYVADGWEGVQGFDVSSPGQPKSIGSYGTKGWAMDVSAAGTKLYVADAFGGLRVLDITDKKNPLELGSYVAPNGHAAKLAVNGNLVFVADIYQGLFVMDVTKPELPLPVSQHSPMGYAHAVDVNGKYAYVAAETYGFNVMDIADPTKPKEVAGLNIEGYAVSIAVSGNTAYLGTFSSGYSKGGCYLYSIDISDPLHPKASSPMPLVGHKGNQTFVGKDSFPDQNPIGIVSRSLFIQGTTLYNAGEWGLLSLDISDPLHPREVSFLQTTPDPGSQDPGVNMGTANGVVVVGNIAYVSVSAGGLDIINLTDPERPVLLGVFNEPAVVDTTGNKNPKGVSFSDVAVSLPFAYVLDLDILRVLDVSDPAHPKNIGSFSLPVVPFNNGGGSARSLAVKGNLLFVADSAAGLLLFDVTDPAKPKLADQLRLPGLAQWIITNEKYVFVAVGNGGLYIIEYLQKSSNSKLAAIPHSQFSAALGVSSVLGQYHPLSFPTGSLEGNTIAVFAPSEGTTYTVSNIEDIGPGSLRGCLNIANSGDTIIFDPQIFPPDNPATIRITGELSLSKGGITIDGSNAGVILDGSGAQKGTICLNIGSNNNIVRGLQIQYFQYAGIELGGQNNIIGGERTRGKGPLGEGNLITGNGIFEIETKAASGNSFVGNYIGTDISGRKKIGQPKSGWSIVIWVASSDNRIENNIIAGSLVFGDSGSSYNEVIGNYIGTDATGTVAFEGDTYIAVSQPFNRIGGIKPGEGNIINGMISIMRTSDILVMGNLIGTDATGKKIFEKAGWLVGLDEGSHHNFVGGTSEAERNIINGGQNSQIIHVGGASNNNFVIGNYISTDITGTLTFPNIAGISVETAEFNYIQRNRISGSTGAGISLSYFDFAQSCANFNLLRGNFITQSSNVGIGVKGGKGNTLVSNSLVNNSINGYDGGIDNQWDDGKQGNYWSDYKGKDANGDGIGDIPCPVAPNGVDNYPLMKPPD